jgi:hypothetical protein
MQIPIVIPIHTHHPTLPVTDPITAPTINPDASPIPTARSRLLNALFIVFDITTF